jgi:hypothetical protein
MGAAVRSGCPLANNSTIAIDDDTANPRVWVATDRSIFGAFNGPKHVNFVYIHGAKIGFFDQS